MKVLLVLLAMILSACQSRQSPPQHTPPPHRGPLSSAGSSSAGSATASGAGEKAGMGGWYGMCEMQRRIEHARTPEERQSLMAEAMPDILPEAREQRLQSMERSCRQE